MWPDLLYICFIDAQNLHDLYAPYDTSLQKISIIQSRRSIEMCSTNVYMRGAYDMLCH